MKDKEICNLLNLASNDPELYLMILFLWEGCLRDDTIIILKLMDKIHNKLYIEHSKTGNKSIIMSPRMIEAWDIYLKFRFIFKLKYK